MQNFDGKEKSMGTEGFGPKIVYTFADNVPLLGGFRVTETLVIMWAITAIIILLALMIPKDLKKVPGKVQLVLEMFVDAIYGFTGSTMGNDKLQFAPYIGTLIIFIAISNISGIFAVRPPTADLNTTLSLALMTFFLVHFNGIRSKGLGTYLKGFFEPFPVLSPINIIGEFATPISLSFRLFGNLIGGMIIVSMLYSALAGITGDGIPFLQLGIPIVFHVYFDLFSGLLQTFIFAMLSMIFISGAME